MGSGQARRKWISNRSRAAAASVLMILALAACDRTESINTPEYVSTAKSPIPIATCTQQQSLQVAVTSSPARISTALPSIEPNYLALDAILTGELAEIPYKLPLTIQYVAETKAVLFFELMEPSEGVLFYGTEGQPMSQYRWKLLDPAVQRHQVVIENLSPDTEYVIWIGLRDADGHLKPPPFQETDWEPVHLRTQHGLESELRIGVIGDSGFGDPTTCALVEKMMAYNLDFVIHTGDLVYRAYEENSLDEAYRRKYYAPFAPLLKLMPIYPVPGNHEYDVAASWQEQPFYFYAFPPFQTFEEETRTSAVLDCWHMVPYGDIQLLMLDSQTFFGASGREAQDQWLIKRLQDDRFRLTIPIFHVAPYSSGLHAADGLAIRHNWHPLFMQAHVPLVLSGHDHNYERLLIDDVTYVVSGGGSSVLYSEKNRLPQSQIFAKQSHFVILSIVQDQIKLEAISLEGETLDRAVIPYGHQIDR